MGMALMGMIGGAMGAIGAIGATVGRLGAALLAVGSVSVNAVPRPAARAAVAEGLLCLAGAAESPFSCARTIPGMLTAIRNAHSPYRNDRMAKVSVPTAAPCSF